MVFFLNLMRWCGFIAPTHQINVNVVPPLGDEHIEQLITTTINTVINGLRRLERSNHGDAPFTVIGRRLGRVLRLSVLHVRSEPAACVGCQLCTRNCPMSLPVHQMVQRGSINSDDCILCGNCVDNCRKDALHFSFRQP